jgi:outer membrane lipoprotein-sorting protein
MRNVRIFSIAVILILMVFGNGLFPSFAAETPVAGSNPSGTDLEDIETRMAAIRTLRSDFIQQKKLSLFEQELEIRGTLLIEKPNRFAWKVQSPVKYFLILDQNRLIQWDEAADQVSETSLKGNPIFEEVVAQVTGWFFGAYSQRMNEYETTILNQKPFVVAFRPKEDSPAASFMTVLRITFLADKRYISEIFIQETSGDSTRLIFENTELNPSIEESEWKVAPGVR